MTATDLTPQAIWERQHQFVREHDAEGQASLFAENAVWELPFAPMDVPRRIEGRAQILAVSKAGMERSKQSGRRITGYKDVTIHQTTDSEVIVVEFMLEGESASRQQYQIPYVQVLRVRDGKIRTLRDYFPGEVLRQALSADIRPSP